LTANIRSRRGSKVDIRVPAFQEMQAGTETKFEDIGMDCMAFGMGCCCLQVTFQAADIHESKFLYDQLATLAPIFLALTAATPILRGRLASTDVRWGVIAASVDDRTPAEKGEASAEADPDMVGGGVTRLFKSRYDSISCYIHQTQAVDFYNDVPCEVDESVQDMLLLNGMDAPVARHLAHLFTRDPLVAFEGAIQEVDDEESTEHFDSINSTNWQTVRWKPPPMPTANGPHVGWRTEFRSMEVQLTDFENAAFTAMLVLVTRAILVFDLDLLVPLSKVDENMDRAHSMDAVNKKTFWFRKHVIPQVEKKDASQELLTYSFEEMTMSEIISGKDNYFPGLVPICFAYLEHIGCDPGSFSRLRNYLRFIQRRASGDLMTPAAWIRRFVRGHPEYKGDGEISQGIAYDLVQVCDEIGRGSRQCHELLGDVVIEPISRESNNYGIPLMGSVDRTAIGKLLDQMCERAPHNGCPSEPCAPMRVRSSMSR